LQNIFFDGVYKVILKDLNMKEQEKKCLGNSCYTSSGVFFPLLFLLF